MRVSQARSTTAPKESVPSTSGERRQILYFNCNFISKRKIMSHFVFIRYTTRVKQGRAASTLYNLSGFN